MCGIFVCVLACHRNKLLHAAHEHIHPYTYTHTDAMLCKCSRALHAYHCTLSRPGNSDYAFICVSFGSLKHLYYKDICVWSCVFVLVLCAATDRPDKILFCNYHNSCNSPGYQFVRTHIVRDTCGHTHSYTCTPTYIHIWIMLGVKFLRPALL